MGDILYFIGAGILLFVMFNPLFSIFLVWEWLSKLKEKKAKETQEEMVQKFCKTLEKLEQKSNQNAQNKFDNFTKNKSQDDEFIGKISKEYIKQQEYSEKNKVKQNKKSKIDIGIIDDENIIDNYIKNETLKEKGDRYEKFIGSKFEEKSGLVIYNGFIRGYEDKGVDIIYISDSKNEINLIQCKNWTKKDMTLDHIKDIYLKIAKYDFDFMELSLLEIQKYLHNYKTIEEIKEILKNIDIDLANIRKTLYISSDKVVDLEIGKYLTMIKENIFKYKDMKIVLIKDESWKK